ncbi:hypothetical protein Tco_1101999 [Tanacetum coccineum]
MSDSEDSMITYTAVSSPFAWLSNIGSLGVDGPTVMPEDPYAYMVAAFQASPSPDYVPGPEYPPLPDFIPEPVYLEFMPPEDDVLLAEEQPLPVALSPTTDLPGYVPELAPEEDPEEDDDEDPEEDPADYPADGGDDGNDKDESSDDEEDDDIDIKEDEEEEEHPTPTDSTVVALPAVDQAPSAEEIQPFKTDESAATPPPHPAYRVARLLDIPTPPPSPHSLWSSPLPHIPSPPLPLILSPLLVSPPLHVSSPPPTSPIRLLGYRAAMIRLRVEAPSTSHSLPLPPPIILSHTRSDAPSSGTPPLLPMPLPTSSPPLHLLSTVEQIDPRPPEGFRVDYGFVATIDREIMRDLKRDVGYRITDTWDEMLVDMPGAPTIDDTELGRQMTEFTTRVRQDTNEIYTRLDDEQTERQLMAGRLNMLYRWKPTGKIFKTVGLRWVPTGKIFTSSTTTVDSDPQNGSNADISNQYESAQTLDVSAGLAPLRQMTSDHNSSEIEIHDHSNDLSRSKLVPKVVPPADKTNTSRQELELLFHHHLTMLSTAVGDLRDSIEIKLVSTGKNMGDSIGFKLFPGMNDCIIRKIILRFGWKPCQGDSLNLPNHRYSKDGDGDAHSAEWKVILGSRHKIKLLTEVALTEAEQIKLATKRSKTQFHSSYASGLGDGVDTQSKVPDDQQQKVPSESWGDSEDEDENDYDDLSEEGDNDNNGNDGNDGDDDDANDDDKLEGDDTNDDDEETDSDRTESDIIKIPVIDQSTTEFYEEEEEYDDEFNIEEDEKMDEEEDDEVTKELYKDVNINLRKRMPT